VQHEEGEKYLPLSDRRRSEEGASSPGDLNDRKGEEVKSILCPGHDVKLPNTFKGVSIMEHTEVYLSRIILCMSLAISNN
jgi:hypothetical protein